MRKHSIKNNRINHEVKKEISRIIESELHDPRVKPMTSVTSVDVATDLKTAKIYISVLGSEEDKQETIEGLNSGKAFIRSLVARNVNLRNTPELEFILDESIEYAINMSKLIDEVNHEDEVSNNDTEDLEDVDKE